MPNQPKTPQDRLRSALAEVLRVCDGDPDYPLQHYRPTADALSPVVNTYARKLAAEEVRKVAVDMALRDPEAATWIHARADALAAPTNEAH